MCRKLTQEGFIARAESVWKGKYDLSKAKYTGMHEPVEVVCEKHGSFYPKAMNFLNGHGCKKCAVEENGDHRRKTTEQFIKEAKAVHGDKYDYSKVVYKRYRYPVIITCPIHGDFKQVPNNHLFGAGCPKCNLGEVRDPESFIRVATKVHDGKYDYSKAVYVNTDTPLEIICPVHGSFFQSPHSHIQGNGCHKCSSSSGERKVRKILKKAGVKFEEQKTFDGCKDKRKLKFDFYLPSTNACIEYQGRQHYPEGADYYSKIVNQPDGFEQCQKRDAIKRAFCKANNIRLLEIRYDENIETKLKEVI